MTYTITETTKLNGLNPEAYLRDIIARVADHPIKHIDELLAWNRRQQYKPRASTDAYRFTGTRTKILREVI